MVPSFPNCFFLSSPFQPPPLDPSLYNVTGWRGGGWKDKRQRGGGEYKYETPWLLESSYLIWENIILTQGGREKLFSSIPSKSHPSHLPIHNPSPYGKALLMHFQLQIKSHLRSQCANLRNEWNEEMMVMVLGETCWITKEGIAWWYHKIRKNLFIKNLIYLIYF
jgi:hypothetical protein